MIDKKQALIRLDKIKEVVPEDFKPMVETIESYMEKVKILTSYHRATEVITLDISQVQKIFNGDFVRHKGRLWRAYTIRVETNWIDMVKIADYRLEEYAEDELSEYYFDTIKDLD